MDRRAVREGRRFVAERREGDAVVRREGENAISVPYFRSRSRETCARSVLLHGAAGVVTKRLSMKGEQEKGRRKKRRRSRHLL